MVAAVEEADRALAELGETGHEGAAMVELSRLWGFDSLESTDRDLEALAAAVEPPSGGAPQRPAAPPSRAHAKPAAPPSAPKQKAPVIADDEVELTDEDATLVDAEPMEVEAELGDLFGDISIPPPAGDNSVMVEHAALAGSEDPEVDTLFDNFQLDDDEEGGERPASADAEGQKGYFGKIFG